LGEYIKKGDLMIASLFRDVMQSPLVGTCRLPGRLLGPVLLMGKAVKEYD
jgi:hypothetical protein